MKMLLLYKLPPSWIKPDQGAANPKPASNTTTGFQVDPQADRIHTMAGQLLITFTHLTAILANADWET